MPAKPKAPAAFDVIAVGDTTVDVFLDIDDGDTETQPCQIDETRQQLCLALGDKIPVEKFTYVPGVGNAANHAVGVARLGLNVGIYTILGEDRTGDECFMVFQKEGVRTDFVQRQAGSATNYSTVLNHQGERIILVYHADRTYDLPDLPPARWLYYSSLAPHHEKLHQQIPAYVTRTGAKLGFNPGSFQLREGTTKLRSIFAVTEVLFVNKEEAQVLIGRSDDIGTLLARLHALGPRIVVITDEQHGSYASEGGRAYYQPIFESPLVERTGAGDSYGSGFIAAMAHGHDIREAMRWGTVNAASVIQYIGAREGLLRQEDIERTLAHHMSFQPKEIEL